ncbi:MAG: hypothetical protein DRO98_05020, partial [Archaeoglobales archaeon]
MIDGNRDNNADGHGIHLFNAADSLIENVYIKNVAKRGLFLDGDSTKGILNSIVKVHVNNVGEDGISLRYNYDNWIYRCYVEHCGRHGVALFSGNNRLVAVHAFDCGRNPDLNGAGIYISSNANELIGCVADTNNQHGINIYNGNRNKILDGYVFDNSAEASGEYSGIRLAGTSTNNTIINCFSGTVSGSPTQKYGIVEEGNSENNVIINCNVAGNVVANIETTDPDTIVAYNQGYKTKNSGTVTININGTPAGTTLKYPVEHGLAVQPDHVMLTLKQPPTAVDV